MKKLGLFLIVALFTLNVSAQMQTIYIEKSPIGDIQLELKTVDSVTFYMDMTNHKNFEEMITITIPDINLFCNEMDDVMNKNELKVKNDYHMHLYGATGNGFQIQIWDRFSTGFHVLNKYSVNGIKKSVGKL